MLLLDSVWAHSVLILDQDVVETTNSDQEENDLDIVEDVDPLLAL